MSKPNGISRKRRGRRATNVNNNRNKSNFNNKSHQNNSISDLFCDIDLSDIKLDLNSDNNSFKSTKSLLNCELTDASKFETNISHSFAKSSVNLNSDPIKTNRKTCFKSLRNLSDFGSNTTNTTTNHNKRKSSVFGDFDLSDLNININSSSTSFQSTRKVIRTEEFQNLSNKENNNNSKENWDKEQEKAVIPAKSGELIKTLRDSNNIYLPKSDLNLIESTVKPNVNQREDNVFSQDFDSDFDFDISMVCSENSKEAIDRKDLNINKNVSKNSTEPTTVATLEVLNKTLEEISEKSKDDNNNAFRTTTSSVNYNSSEVCESDCNLNAFSEKSLSIFKDFDLSDLKSNDSFNSFERVSKVFKTRHSSVVRNASKLEEYSPFFSIDFKSLKCSPIPETTRKTIISNVFDELDFSDFKFSDSDICFRNSRTAFNSMKSTELSDNMTTNDCNDVNELFDQTFSESKDFRTSSPKPKTSSSMNKFKPMSSSPKSQSSKSQEMDFSFEIDDQFFESCIEKTDQKSEQTSVSIQNLSEVSNITINEKFDSDDSFDSLQDISFSLRSDFATYNEMTSEEFFTQMSDNFKVDNNQSEGFKGFHSGRGQPIIISEEQLSTAKLIFKDIEDWLLKEITESRHEFRVCDKTVSTYSQKFVSDVGNGGQTVVSNLNDLLENESIETFAQIMSSTNDN